MSETKGFTNKKVTAQFPISGYFPAPQTTNLNQVRKTFDNDYIKDMALDIRGSESKQPNNPITVYTTEKGYFLETGENRYKAQTLNFKIDPLTYSHIRATIKGVKPTSKLVIQQNQIKER